MRLKFYCRCSNSNITMREVIMTSILKGFDQENPFFEGWSWSKFNNLGVALHQCEKRVKTKSQKV